MKKISLLAIVTVTVLSTPVIADVYMDAAWAKKACAAWNASTILTQQLANTDSEEDDGYQWAKNNADRGYKLVQMYRTSCGANSRIQLTIQEQGGKAMCVRSGKPDGKAMNFKVDYLMHASDKNWGCMGRGSFGCGAMGAMMSGKLKFQGPKVEAMKVMEPFESFLKVAGKVPGDKTSCPQ